MTENPDNTGQKPEEQPSPPPISEALKGDIEKYREKLAADPSSLAFLPLAESLRKAGQLQEALEICRQGLEKHPDHTSGQVAMAKILLDLDDQPGAREILEKVIEATPDHLLANKLLGRIYLQAGEKDKARQRLTIVVMLNSTDEEAVEALQSLELVAGGEREIPKPPAPAAGPGIDRIPEGEDREDVVISPSPAGSIPEDEQVETEISEDEELPPTINTETLADLYVSQDLPEKAIDIYRGLLADDPDNETLKVKLQKALALQGGEQEGLETAQSPPGEEKSSRRRDQIVLLEKWLRSIREKRSGIQ